MKNINISFPECLVFPAESEETVMAIIRMRDHLYDEIVNYAKEHLPEEACGLLAGVETEEGREIQKVYFLENKDHAEDHFTLDPRDQMNAIKDMPQPMG